MSRVLGVIPARMDSSRFPGKPLEKILDTPMLAHCYERALLANSCDSLVIATPDDVIMNWAEDHHIPAVLTGHHHNRATERAKEVLDILSERGEFYDVILLLQGDEPQIFPADIESLKAAFTKKTFEVVNLVYPIEGDDLTNPNVVKSILNQDLQINFFSRSHIPHYSTNAIRQLGMIGFTNAALKKYTELAPTPLEELESIDMMRFLENNLQIKGVLSTSPILGVDNPADIARAERMMAGDVLVELYKAKYLS